MLRRCQIRVCCALLMISSAFAVKFPNDVQGTPEIGCDQDKISISVKTTSGDASHIFAKGRFGDAGCNYNKTNSASFSLSACGMNRQRQLEPKGLSYNLVVVVQMHPQFITKVDRAYHIKCFYMEADKVVTSNIEVSMITTDLITAGHAMPQCMYTLHMESPNGPLVKYAKIGDKVWHVWDCPSDVYGMLVHSCTVDDGQGSRIKILDENGCGTDRYVMRTPEYGADSTRAQQETHVFKFADKVSVYFNCQIKLCFKPDACAGVTPPRCPDTPAAGAGVVESSPKTATSNAVSIGGNTTLAGAATTTLAGAATTTLAGAATTTLAGAVTTTLAGAVTTTLAGAATTTLAGAAATTLAGAATGVASSTPTLSTAAATTVSVKTPSADTAGPPARAPYGTPDNASANSSNASSSAVVNGSSGAANASKPYVIRDSVFKSTTPREEENSDGTSTTTATTRRRTTTIPHRVATADVGPQMNDSMLSNVERSSNLEIPIALDNETDLVGPPQVLGALLEQATERALPATRHFSPHVYRTTSSTNASAVNDTSSEDEQEGSGELSSGTTVVARRKTTKVVSPSTTTTSDEVRRLLDDGFLPLFDEQHGFRKMAAVAAGYQRSDAMGVVDALVHRRHDQQRREVPQVSGNDDFIIDVNQEMIVLEPDDLGDTVSNDRQLASNASTEVDFSSSRNGRRSGEARLLTSSEQPTTAGQVCISALGFGVMLSGFALLFLCLLTIACCVCMRKGGTSARDLLTCCSSSARAERRRQRLFTSGVYPQRCRVSPSSTCGSATPPASGAYKL